jgi:hypothetical protein
MMQTLLHLENVEATEAADLFGHAKRSPSNHVASWLIAM